MFGLPWVRSFSSGSRLGWKSTEGFPDIICRSPRLRFIPGPYWFRQRSGVPGRGGKSNPEFGFLLGWVIGPLALPGVLADPTAALHPTGLSRLCAARCLDGGGCRWRGGDPSTVAAGPAGAKLAGRDRYCGNSRLAGGRGDFPCTAAAASGNPGGLLMGVGTLAAMLWLHEGPPGRQVLAWRLIWVIFMLVAGGWLIPAAEPYRTSRRVGQRLAALSARTGHRTRTCSITRSQALSTPWEAGGDGARPA